MSFSQITTMAFGKEEIFETGKIARFADSSITLKSDNSVILSAVVSEKELKNEDFLPLTVQYIEKSAMRRVKSRTVYKKRDQAKRF